MPKMDLKEIRTAMEEAMDELAKTVDLSQQVLVLGASTSEIQGQRIGTASDGDIARALLDPVMEASRDLGFDLAVQCCEHLNRALIVEDEVSRRLSLPPCSVIPTAEAGGALASRAAEQFNQPVVVESISARVGIDVGHTLIGMHLEPVVVPLRLRVKRVGQTCLLAAASRPRLIGGERGRYPRDRWTRVIRS